MSITRACPGCGYRHGYASAALADAHFPRHSCGRQLHRALVAQRRAARLAAAARCDCSHSGRPHEHGTRVAYVKDRCRCPECTAANTATSQAAARNRILGRRSRVDAQPVQAHIQQLRRAGIGYDQIARLSGTSATHIREIAGVVARSGRRSPIRNLHASTAARITRIAAIAANRAPGSQIDATGTRRRLQALVATGWPVDELARRLDRTRTSLLRTMTSHVVTARTAQRISELHEQLWDIAAPQASDADRVAAATARAYAARHGWQPTLAWDDIDTDPHPSRMRPISTAIDVDEIAIERAIAGDGIRLANLTPAEQTYVIQYLTEHGQSIRDIAEQLATTTRTVSRRRRIAARAA